MQIVVSLDKYEANRKNGFWFSEIFASSYNESQHFLRFRKNLVIWWKHYFLTIMTPRFLIQSTFAWKLFFQQIVILQYSNVSSKCNWKTFSQILRTKTLLTITCQSVQIFDMIYFGLHYKTNIWSYLLKERNTRFN